MRSDKRFSLLRAGRAGSTDLRGAKAALGALLWLVCAASSPVFAGRIFVDIDAVGMNNGSSWENAYNHLRDAIAASSSGDEIRVAQGVYRPDRGSGITLGDRGATFHLVDNVALSGGYAGYGQPVPDARNITVYETVLSGDLAGNDAGTINVRNLLGDASRSENCYNVVTGTDCSETTVVDGFTITGGNANGTRDRDKYGGGVHDGSLTLGHCRIVGNSAFNGGGVGCYGGGTLLESIVSGNCARSGGGLYDVLKVVGSMISGNCAIQYSGGGMSILSAATMVTDSEIDDNWCLQNGGGLYVVQCNPTFRRCSFGRNSADGKGGGIYVDGGTSGGIPNFHQCRIVGNTSGGDGGGIHSSGYSLSKLSSCVLTGNIAGGKGGGTCDASNRGSSLVNCTLAHNSATGRGGGVCYNSYPASERVLTSCILWYNSDSLGATSDYSQLCNTAGPFIVPIRYCDVQGWSGTMGGGGTVGTIGDEPLFVDSDGADDIAGTEDDNFRLQEGSKCIDAGDNSAVEEGATDFAGAARIIHGIVDIGAYESKAGGPHVLPRYDLVDLGTLGGLYSAAYGINDCGQVVGLSETEAGAQHAFLWDEKVGMIDLGTLGGSASYAYAINNAGQAVGSARTASGELHAFLWTNGEMIDLGLLPGGSCTEAYAINDAGQIVGMARTSANIYSWQRAFLWEDGIMTSLGVLEGASNSSAADINIRGEVVGTSGDRAFLWDSTSGMRKLTDLQSQGNAVSDGGLALLASSGTYYVRDSGGVLSDMGLIRYSRMNSINNRGQVVGDFDYLGYYHAFLWDDSYGMIDLNYLAPAEAGWDELNSAGDINSDGRIVGYGWTEQGPQHAFLMSPIPAAQYLVAHWELDESSGATAEDSVGNNDGVLHGGPQWRPSGGRVNGALEFDGLDDYVDCGGGTVFDITDEITVAAWVNIRRVNMDWQTIVAKGDSGWRLSTAEDEMRFHFAVTGGPPWNFVNGEIVVDADEWHHVCGTYDGINMRLYIDGVEDSASPVAESNGVSVNDYNVFIGENEERTGRHWDGLIDDVRIYSCPLTTAEAYELFMEAPIYVDGDSTGRNDGSTWADAFNSLQDALAAASSGNRIHVAAGVYTPDSGATAAPGDRTATFQLIDGVSVRGGFAGFGQASPKLRDVTAYESILSGDLAADDGAGFENNGENSYHVVTGSGTNSATVLDGFTVSGGNAESLGGGGMLNISGGPTVRDCKFSANSAAKGGGMYNEQAYPTITGASFIENRAFLDSADDDLGGGGMYNYKSSAMLEDCLFAGNSVVASTGDGGDGGAIFCDQSSPRLVNCVMLANRARRSGGGMMSRWGGAGVGGLLVNCLFNANSAGVKGGGLDILDDTIRLTNCTFSANLGTSGGGIYSESAEAVLVNCILYGNTDNGGNVENAQIRNAGGSLAIDYSCVEGWSGTLGGTGNIGSNPHFEDADGADNIAGTADDDLRISAGSLCIDAGSNAALPPLILTDLDGNPRIIRDVVDMGAYEFAGMLRWYVDGANGDNNNNGLSPETAFATIQKGINTATEGYTVVVLPGVYQEDVYFNGKALTVTGEGSDATILEEGPSGYAVRFIRGEDANSVLKNVVIRNCQTYAGIRIENSSPKITNVTVVDNRLGITNIGWGHPDISNSIFWNNSFKDISCEVSCGSVTYCCIERGLAGEGNITADPSGPLFADLAGGDYHLRSGRGRHRPTTSEWILDDVTSPCVDGGNPSANPSEERMPNGGRLNMGAFGGTYYASMSEWPLAGDMNHDGVINLKDFALVAEKWLSAMEWAE